jgi:sugar-specific transcriptional regulator TrmB
MMAFGLSKNEALLYVRLLSGGQCSAGKLAKSTKIHRVDVYRLLKRLAEKQVLDIILGSPTLYRAKDPEVVLRNLYEQKQRTLVAIRDGLPGLSEDLSQLQSSQGSDRRSDEIDGHDFRLSYGRTNYISDVTEMTKAAKSSLLIVMTTNSIKRAFSTSTVDLWAKKLAEGVAIKIILDRKLKGGKEALHLSKIFNARSSTSAIMRLTIFDESSVLLCATDDVDLSISNPSDVYLKTTDKKFALVMKLLFDHMWKNSRHI